MKPKQDIVITEVALRDGSHVLSHQYTVEQVSKVVRRSWSSSD